jgi:protein involved in polysaccharide export with SLBB domain
MGRTVSLFLVRAFGMLLAGMLLYAVFAPAHAQTDTSYGLKRFPGDNYDSVPPGAGIPAPPAPQGYAPVSGSGVSPSGYYGTLNGGTSAPVGGAPVGSSVPMAATPAYQQAPSQQPQPYPAQAQSYQPVSGYAQPAPAWQPQSSYQPQGAYQAPPEPYGYRPLPPAQPQYPQTAAAAANPYAYYQPQAVTSGRAGYDYMLGPGDKLRLTVFGETDLSGEFVIDGSGFARLPLIGQIRAAGSTSQQLEAMIGSALSQGYLKSPRVSVEVTTYRPFYIIGAVNRPGQYPYIDHMNALNAIALAGGFTNGAVESVLFVRREGSNQEVEVPADRTTEIYPGDVVKVHTTFFTDAMNLLSPFSGIAASAATAAVIQ